MELNKLDWNTSKEGSITINSSKPVHPVEKQWKNGLNATSVTTVPHHTIVSNLFTMVVYTKQGKSHNKTKTFATLEVLPDEENFHLVVYLSNSGGPQHPGLCVQECSQCSMGSELPLPLHFCDTASGGVATRLSK